MQKKLPARPSLEHLRGQAKSLLAAYRSGDPAAAEDFNRYGASGGLSAAQLVIARKHDFATWPRLVHYVEQLQELEGSWGFLSLEVEGSKMPAPSYSAARLVIDGDRFRMVSSEGTYEGIFDIDVETSPHTIDIDFVAGPEAGNSSFGIYALADGRLTICLGFTGVPRPSSFATSAGSGLALETLERAGNPAPPEAEPAIETEAVDPAEFEVLTPTHVQIEGEWDAVSLITGGMPLPAHFAKHGRRISSGTRVTVRFGAEVWMEALTRIDATADPASIDFLVVGGPSDGQVRRGVLRFGGDQLETCFDEVGKPRPSAFESPPGSTVTLSVWKRRR